MVATMPVLATAVTELQQGMCFLYDMYMYLALLS